MSRRDNNPHSKILNPNYFQIVSSFSTHYTVLRCRKLLRAIDHETRQRFSYHVKFNKLDLNSAWYLSPEAYNDHYDNTERALRRSERLFCDDLSNPEGVRPLWLLTPLVALVVSSGASDTSSATIEYSVGSAASAARFEGIMCTVTSKTSLPSAL